MKRVKIGAVKPNPNNPRTIKGHKFEKLVKSIETFPEMLDLRPIVVNDEMVVLGGNMRLRACQEAGLKEVPNIKASNLTEEQKRSSSSRTTRASENGIGMPSQTNGTQKSF